MQDVLVSRQAVIYSQTEVIEQILSAFSIGAGNDLVMSEDAKKHLDQYVFKIVTRKLVNEWVEVKKGVCIKARYAGRQCQKYCIANQQVGLSKSCVEQAIVNTKSIVVTNIC